MFQKQHYLDVVFSITPLSHSVFFDLIGVENNKSHICIFKSKFPVSINLLNLKLKKDIFISYAHWDMNCGNLWVF